MHTLQRTSLGIAVVFLAISACVIPSVTITDPIAQATIMAATIDAAIRGTQAAQPAVASASSGASTPGISVTSTRIQSMQTVPATLARRPRIKTSPLPVRRRL